MYVYSLGKKENWEKKKSLLKLLNKVKLQQHMQVGEKAPSCCVLINRLFAGRTPALEPRLYQVTYSCLEVSRIPNESSFQVEAS